MNHLLLAIDTKHYEDFVDTAAVQVEYSSRRHVPGSSREIRTDIDGIGGMPSSIRLFFVGSAGQDYVNARLSFYYDFPQQVISISGVVSKDSQDWTELPTQSVAFGGQAELDLSNNNPIMVRLTFAVATT